MFLVTKLFRSGLKSVRFNYKSLLTILLFVFSYSLYGQNFQLASNNKTITCDGASFGQTGVVGGKTYTKVNRSTLQTMISNGSDVTCVCTSGITNMQGLFQNNQTFNQDISSWDTSNVSNMQGLFQNARAFNQDIGYWDVSSMNDQNGVNQLFDNATNLNQDLSYWCFPNNYNIYQNRQNIWGNNNPIKNNSSLRPRFSGRGTACRSAKVATPPSNPTVQIAQIGSDIETANPSINYYFGRKLDATPSMDHIVTGTTSYFESGGVSRPIGMAEVYKLNNGVWQRKGNRIKGDAYNTSVGNNLFGMQVSISSNGDRVAVVSRNQNNTAANQTNNGAIYIYQYNSSTQNWDLLNTIWGVNGGYVFHAEMTPDGEHLIYVSNNITKVLEYTPSGVSSWTQVGQDLSTNATGGLDISDNSQRIIIHNSLANNLRGEIYIYDYNSSNTRWELIQTLSGESDYDRLGGSETRISGDGETIIAAETFYDSTDDEGRLKVWKYNSSASPKWSLTGIPSEFLGENADDSFANGVSVNYDGSRIAAGALRSYGGRSNNG